MKSNPVVVADGTGFFDESTLKPGFHLENGPFGGSNR
jgi:hypothetical protein